MANDSLFNAFITGSGQGILILGMACCSSCKMASYGQVVDAAVETNPPSSFDVNPKPQFAAPEGIELVSVGRDGALGNDISLAPSMSDDGQRIAFESFASNLIENDDNQRCDVFLRDRNQQKTEIVSRGFDGRPTDGDSYSPSLSRDGRFLAFDSRAANLVADDTNEVEDIFLYDAATKKMKRLSLTHDGGEANGDSFKPSISGDGSKVSFVTLATNIIARRNIKEPALVIRSRLSNDLALIDPDPKITPNISNPAPSLSREGRYIAYGFDVIGETDQQKWLGPAGIIVYDTVLKKGRRVALPADLPRQRYEIKISPDGDQLSLITIEPNELEARTGLKRGRERLIFDLRKDESRMELLAANGLPPDNDLNFPGVSADGEFFVFSSVDSNLVPHQNDKDQLYVMGLKRYFLK